MATKVKPETVQVTTRTWPVIRPTIPRKYTLKCSWAPIIIIAGVMMYPIALASASLMAVAVVLLALLIGIPVCCVWVWLRTWGWYTDAYTKILFLASQSTLKSHMKNRPTAQDITVDGLHPKKQSLEKYDVHYALNLRVPKGSEEEFVPMAGSFIVWVEENLRRLPMTDYFEQFGPGEDPVEYAMHHLGSVYPEIYQVWDDKQSDEALTRFCQYGMGAHRIQTTTVDGSDYFVVRCNALSSLPVRKGFAHYGGDVYFHKGGDCNWRVAKIIDSGLHPGGAPVTVRPGEAGWAHAKFRFRSSMTVLVTLVDHLFGTHLQISNLAVTAVRETLSAAHPIRRFMTPFLFKTIQVNDNARNNLTAPRTMAMRSMGFSEHGMQIAFASAPALLLSTVPTTNPLDILDRGRLIKAYRACGIDTEYYRQYEKFWVIFKKFVRSYIDCYYATPEAVAADRELRAFVQQYFMQSSFIKPGDGANITTKGRSDPKFFYELLVSMLTSVCVLVTAGHEHVGALEVYAQDVSFCALKWTPGAMAGTKQTAIAQALLMAFTATPMPQLLGSDWTHVFPPVKRSEGNAKEKKTISNKRDPVACYRVFQEELRQLVTYCDRYNAEAASRAFPENFPLYCFNPKYLECSISV